MRKRAMVQVAAGLSLIADLSCSPPIKGQVLLVVETDMSVPKDIDGLTIEISDARHNVAPLQFAEDAGMGVRDLQKLKLPATLAVSVGDDPSTPVTFRVTAFKDTNVRVVRETVTTIPPDRTAMLRMPLQWLCDQTFCADGQTCVDGSCKTNAVGALLDYDPASIFSGEFDNGLGVCFNTSCCFAGDLPLIEPELNEGICTIPWDGDSDVNVAIATETDGICGPDGCFVSLNADGDHGWKRVEGKPLIQLPPELCSDEIKKRILGMVVQKSAICGLVKKESMPPCGAWSSVGSPGPLPDTEEPVTLAAGQKQPVALVLHDQRISWANVGSVKDGKIMANEGEIASISIDGGMKTLLASNQNQPRSLALVRDVQKASHLFWTKQGGPSEPSNGSVCGVKIDSNTNPEEPCVKLGLNAPSGIAHNAQFLFLATVGDAKVWSLPLDSAMPLNIASQKAPFAVATTNPSQLDADKTAVFWIEGDQLGSIHMRLIDPPSSVMSLPSTSPLSLVLDREGEGPATAVYWTESEKVMKATVQAQKLGAPEVIAEGQLSPSGIALLGDFVFWANRGDGAVWQANKDGSSKCRIAVTRGKIGAIAVDATNVYWVNEGSGDRRNGALMRFARKSSKAPCAAAFSNQ